MVEVDALITHYEQVLRDPHINEAGKAKLRPELDRLRATITRLQGDYDKLQCAKGHQPPPPPRTCKKKAAKLEKDIAGTVDRIATDSRALQHTTDEKEKERLRTEIAIFNAELKAFRAEYNALPCVKVHEPPAPRPDPCADEKAKLTQEIRGLEAQLQQLKQQLSSAHALKQKLDLEAKILGIRVQQDKLQHQYNALPCVQQQGRKQPPKPNPVKGPPAPKPHS
jgi:predicted  nucleic acid-binding Zn-ribbon protein